MLLLADSAVEIAEGNLAHSQGVPAEATTC